MTWDRRWDEVHPRSSRSASSAGVNLDHRRTEVAPREIQLCPTGLPWLDEVWRGVHPRDGSSWSAGRINPGGVRGQVEPASIRSWCARKHNSVGAQVQLGPRIDQHASSPQVTIAIAWDRLLQPAGPRWSTGEPKCAYSRWQACDRSGTSWPSPGVYFPNWMGRIVVPVVFNPRTRRR